MRSVVVLACLLGACTLPSDPQPTPRLSLLPNCELQTIPTNPMDWAALDDACLTALGQLAPAGGFAAAQGFAGNDTSSSAGGPGNGGSSGQNEGGRDSDSDGGGSNGGGSNGGGNNGGGGDTGGDNGGGDNGGGGDNDGGGDDGGDSGGGNSDGGDGGGPPL